MDKSIHKRLNVDIKDLDLSKLTELENIKCVAISKHLCGAATDISLRCILNHIESGGEMKGMVIALCCHHICNFGMYINQEYLLKHNITATEFSFLSTLSSWATNGASKEVVGDPDDEITHWSKLCYDERETFGLKCKRVIDMGRIEYLQQNGYKVELSYYVDKDKSLENLVLTAVKE